MRQPGAAQLIDELARIIEGMPARARPRVAVDGPDAAGKTTLARALAGRILRPVVATSIDDWHNPLRIRSRRGDLSPEGYYRDSFDVVALREELLDPFAAGAPTVRTVRFDYRADREARVEVSVPLDAVLIVEGVFLLRPELRSLWDLAVYLEVPESVTLARATSRDVAVFSSGDAVAAR